MTPEEKLRAVIKLGIEESLSRLKDNPSDGMVDSIIAVLRINLMRDPSLIDNLVSGWVRVPITPSPGLINSMCIRYAHDFGVDKQEIAKGVTTGWTKEEREALRTTMRQIHQEVVGTGYYRPDLEDNYLMKP